MIEAKQYIFNKSEDSEKANILIDGEISAWWGVGLRDMAKDIANSGASEIMMQINSGGGSVFEGMAISAFIIGNNKSGLSNISTSILGLCASIATPIALSGKTTSIAKGSRFMIHNASAFMGGEASDLRSTADLLESIDGQLTQIYVDAIEKNGKLINDSREETEEQVTKWQNKETWFTAEEAVEHGFIQKLTEGVEFVNKAQAQEIVNSCSKYKNVPTTFLNKVKTIANMAEPKNDDTKKLGVIDTMLAWFKSNPKEAQAAIEGLQEDQEAKEAAEREAAIASAKKYGIYKEPTSEDDADEEEDNTSDLQAQLDAEIEARKVAELKAQKLEEEKNGASSAGAKTDLSKMTDKEKDFHNLLAESGQLENADAMAKEMFS